MKMYTTVLASMLASTLCLTGTTYGQGASECADAVDASLNGATAFSNAGASTSTETCGDCSGSGPEYYTCTGADVWFKLSLPGPGLISIDTCQAGSFDTDLTLYQGSCAFMAPVACSGDGSGLGGCQNYYSALEFDAPSAGEYYIRIGGYNGSTGSGTMNVSYVNASDCDNDGTPDGDEADCNSDGIPDDCQNDCDSNGTADVCEIAGGAADCNTNGLPDSCDLADGTSGDFNDNGIPDDCEAQEIVVPFTLSTGTGGECFPGGPINVAMSGVVLQAIVELNFSYAVSDGTWAGDVLLCMENPDGTGCIQLGGYNLSCASSCANAQGFPSSWSTGTQGDYAVTIPLNQFGFQGDGDYTFNMCHGWSNASEVATWDGTVTFKYLPGVFVDCNDNDVPDDQDILDGADDCNTNGIPDECEDLEDCNTDGIADTCQLASDDGTLDCDGDGVIDSCEPVSPDRNNNGLNDFCEEAGDLCADAPVMQPNDTSLCSNLLTLPVPEQIAVICVTDGGDSFSGANRDVWRSITVDGPGVLSLTTCDIDGDDTDLAVWDACVDGTPLACSGDAEVDANCQLYYSALEVILTEATTVKIQVGGYNDSTAVTLVNTYLTSTWTPDAAPCEADFDNNGTRNGGDLGLLLGGWGPVTEASDNAAYDLNNDGEVSGADIGLFLGLFGDC